MYGGRVQEISSWLGKREGARAAEVGRVKVKSSTTLTVEKEWEEGERRGERGEGKGGG